MQAILTNFTVLILANEEGILSLLCTIHSAPIESKIFHLFSSFSPIYSRLLLEQLMFLKSLQQIRTLLPSHKDPVSRPTSKSSSTKA
jgi:hypothetical protein